MAIPRYAPSEVRLQTAENVAYGAKSQAYQNLSQKLDAFRGTVYKYGAQQREREAKEQAIQDVAQGKFQDVGDFTIYDQAYKDTARSAYLAKTEQDAKDYSSYLKTQLDLNPETKDNPDAYVEAWDSYSKQILSEAPDETVRASLSQSINKYGMAQYNSIAKAKADALDKYNREAYDGGIKLYSQEYKDAVLSRDPQEINIATQKLMAMYQNGISNLYTNENDVKLELQQLKKDTFKEVSMQGFKESTNRIDYISKIRDNKELDAKETQGLIDMMHKEMQSEYDDEKLLRQKEDEDTDRLKKSAEKSLNVKLLNDELNQKDLDEALAIGAIDRGQYDDYFDRMKTEGFTKDDDEEYQFYLKNIDTTTPEMIMDARLTKQSKQKLLDRLDDLSDWEKSSNGKQAILEIKNHFQVFEGTILSKADINNQNMKDYGTLRSMYYDIMEGTDLEQRSLKALELGRDLLKSYQNGDIPDTKPYFRLQDEKRLAEEQKQLEAKKEKEEVKGSSIFSKFIEW